MSNMARLLVIFTLLLCDKTVAADNLLLVTIDGLRWQEVFRGFDQELLADPKITKKTELLPNKFAGETRIEKRQKLMPFLWGTLAKKGVLIGNRDLQSYMAVSNNWWFSYPGYNELLAGKADPKINSNEARPNPNISFLEYLNQQTDFKQQIAVFGGWDVFPAILNVERSKLFVNAGFMPAAWPELSPKAVWLNQLQTQIPSPWHNVRLDAFTIGLAAEYVKAKQPKVIYLALGETDDFAHDGQYHQYLQAVNRSDQMIADFWQQLQAIPQYRHNTNLLITVDHGRGNNKQTWQHHSSKQGLEGYLSSMASDVKDTNKGIEGSDQIWLAAMGPDTPAIGELSQTSTRYLSQVAATALKLLEKPPAAFATDIGSPIAELQK